MRQYDQRNLSMVMDFYEMTMSNGYFNTENADTRVAFDVFYRKNPDNGGFAIFAGLEQIIEYINDLHFSREDISYLREQGVFGEEFLEYLANFRFQGDIYAFREGTIMYPGEPGYYGSCAPYRCPIGGNGDPAAGESSVVDRDKGTTYREGGKRPCGQ